MSFTSDGGKTGFDRNTFFTAMTESGIPASVSNHLIDSITTLSPSWNKLIEDSFLPEDLKNAYHRLISNRLRRL